MKTTLMQRSAATVLSVSAVEGRLCAPTAALAQGTGVSAAVRVRHTADAFAFDSTVLGTTVDVVGLGTAADAAPPPRGAPV